MPCCRVVVGWGVGGGNMGKHRVGQEAEEEGGVRFTVVS